MLKRCSVICIIIFMGIAAMSMKTVFAKLLKDGYVPKNVININFRQYGQVYLPVEDRIEMPCHFDKVFEHQAMVNTWEDNTELVVATDGSGILGISMDWTYFGFHKKFTGMYMYIPTPFTAPGAFDVTFEYYDDPAGWTVLDFVDNTNDLDNSGAVTWNDPGSGWVPCEINGSQYYWIRMSIDTVASGLLDEVKVMGAKYSYKIYNDCVMRDSLGEVHRKFNIEPENYGPATANWGFSLVNNELIRELLYHENWQGLPVQYIKYFDAYSIGRSEEIYIGELCPVKTGACQPLVISYDFANTGQNIQQVFFNGFITAHPPCSEGGVSVDCDSIESRWDEAEIPRYRINEYDWPRCPQENIGKPGQIIMGSDTIHKRLLCVDEGAVAEAATAYDETATTIACLDLGKWSRAIRDNLVVLNKDEEILVGTNVNLQQGTFYDVIRGYRDTTPTTIEEGDILYEYRPRETWLVGSRELPINQIGADKSVDIIAINPEDAREQYKVLADWYIVTENANLNGHILTYLDTIRPLLGYFPSTEITDKILKTNQDGTNPNQCLERLDAYITKIGYPSFFSWLGNEYGREYVALLPLNTSVPLSEGWSNVENLFTDNDDAAIFQGSPKWNNYNKRYAKLTLDLSTSDLWGMSGLINNLGTCTMAITPTIWKVQGTGGYFWRGNYLPVSGGGEPYANYFKLGGGMDQLFEPNSSTYYPTNLANSSGYHQSILVSVTNWEDFSIYPINIYVSDSFTQNMNDGTAQNLWQDQSCGIEFVKIYAYVQRMCLWDVPPPPADTHISLPNLSDNNDLTFHEANGLLPDDGRWQGSWAGGSIPTTPTRTESILTGGLGTPPIETVNVIKVILRCVFECSLDPWTSGNESVRIHYYQRPSTSSINHRYAYLDNATTSPLEMDITNDFDQAYWTKTYINIYVLLCYHDPPPLKLYNVQVIVKYTDTNTTLWTDDEEFPTGYVCDVLESDGPKSYAWLMRKSSGGYYENKDATIKCKVSVKDLDFGLARKVYLQIPCQINPYNPVTNTGGCMHDIGTERTPAAWAWYGHINYRNSSTCTSNTGQVVQNEIIFRDDNATFATWGIKPGDIVYYFEDDNDPILNQGTYVVKHLGNDINIPDQGNTGIYLVIDIEETKKWDIRNPIASWNGWEEAGTTIEYKIHRPHLLLQDGTNSVQEFDITDEAPPGGWDADLDFDGLIYVRGHLWTQPSMTGDPPYYDRDENVSLFRLWMPKLRLVFNAGKKAIITARHLNGICSGSTNPVTLLKELALYEANVDDEFINDASWDAVEANKEGVSLVDYAIDDIINFRELRTNLTVPFNWTILFEEQMIARDASVRKLLPGTVITDDPTISAYGATTQYFKYDYSEPGHAAVDSEYGTEVDATTGFSSPTGDTLTSVADPRTGSSGSYSIRNTAIGEEAETLLTYSDTLRLLEDCLLVCWMKASTALNIYIGIKLADYHGSVYDHGEIVPVDTTWRKYYLKIPKDSEQGITGLFWNSNDCNIADTYQIDDIKLLMQRQLPEPPSQILVSDPIYYQTMGSVGKIGTFFTEATLFYRIYPWNAISDLTQKYGGLNAKILTTQGSSSYTRLQNLYGKKPFGGLKELKMISDDTTAAAYFASLQRYISERLYTEGMELGQAGLHLSVGDIILLGHLHYYPEHYKGEADRLKYVQIISVSDRGKVSFVEINDNLNNCLI